MDSFPGGYIFWMLFHVPEKPPCLMDFHGKISQAPRGASRIARHSVEVWDVKKSAVSASKEQLEHGRWK